MDNKIIRRPVKTLSPDVARKIAAGEVIDRPAAIVRELMDNAVDSGADYIEVEINGGGIDSIRISDNGIGMSKEDLIACARPHATSKIVEASDLMNLSTLGFRGEALASIAAVSRLTISSNTYRMKASLTDDHLITEIPPIQNGKGTIVQSEGLFENFPARRIFLKRPGSETLMCKEVFIEKSLPRTDISFRLTVDNEIKLDLPQNTTLAERFTSALQLKESPSLFSELKNQAEDWNFTLLIGEPSVYRNDRKHIYIYVNGRRVQEYSLIQAIEYGCQGFFPNGTHPFAALFVQINPALVDFNIHPAKKEVRFKDSSSLHHGVSTTTRNFFKSYGIKQANEYEK
ncbi:MAG: DNA mismatch repair endonuclease MutL, partial [Treponema sp.]|nr:DNA mismatch repair endonuclease MutL [Treponema sp.]